MQKFFGHTLRSATSDASRFEQWLPLSRGLALLAINDVAQLVVGGGVLLWVSRVCGRRILVQAVSIHARMRTTEAGPRSLVIRSFGEDVVQCHAKQDSLHDGCQQEYAPGAPTSPSQPCSQTCSEEKAARCLDTHHGNAQASNML